MRPLLLNLVPSQLWIRLGVMASMADMKDLTLIGPGATNLTATGTLPDLPAERRPK